MPSAPAASMKSAASSTPRVIGPATDSPFQSRAIGSRPRVGLRPNRPHAADGIRIEPAPSVPSAAAASPAATAAPDPPLEPPGVRARSHGLCVAPNASDSVLGIVASSGTWVLPSSTQPAARSRRTISSSASAGPPWASEPHAVTWPAMSVSSLIAIGTPFSGGASVAAAGVGRVGRGERLVGEHDPERAQLRVEPLDPLEVELGQLARGDLARPDQLGLAREAGEGEVGRIHRAEPTGRVRAAS